MSYIGNSPGNASQRVVTRKVATAGQTRFASDSGYATGYVDVIVNGSDLVAGVDFNETGDGINIDLVEACAADDNVKIIAWIPRGLSDGYLKSETNTLLALKADITSANGALAIPKGTTAQRPSNPDIGYTRYNTTLGALENYTSNGWVKISTPMPVINNVSGTFYAGYQSTITLTGFNFGTNVGVAKLTVNGNTYNINVTPVSDSTLSFVVPSSVYNSGASSVDIVFQNFEGGQSAATTKSIVSMPTGGNITVSGNYRIHTFTSSSALTVPSGFSTTTAEVLTIAGGGGGGEGGGGAGGTVYSSNVSLSSGTYNATVGGGGTGTPNGQSTATNGSNSVFGSLNTAIGGGAGGVTTSGNGSAGGCGGGGRRDGGGSGGAGTSGQGYSGGTTPTAPWHGGGGGGGYSGAGYAGQGGAQTSEKGGNGGAGGAWSISGTTQYYAGGGGGATEGTGGYGAGGIGGGGRGYSNYDGIQATSGSTNTGGGGGGRQANSGAGVGGAGGSGIIIVRYPLPT